MPVTLVTTLTNESPGGQPFSGIVVSNNFSAFFEVTTPVNLRAKWEVSLIHRTTDNNNLVVASTGVFTRKGSDIHPMRLVGTYAGNPTTTIPNPTRLVLDRHDGAGTLSGKLYVVTP